MRNLATALFTHGQIRTTEPKAKELSRVADEMITLAKQGGLHARRQAESFLYQESIVARLFSTIAPWYKQRQGGYTRILKLGPRPGDNAPMAYIELVDRQPLGVIRYPVAPKKKFKKAAKGKAEAKPKKAAEKPAEKKPVKKAPAKAKSK
jgi:large subunit ribosomal protein L17